MAAHGLYRGTSGNISARVPGGFLITPTGYAAEDLTPSALVLMDLEGRAKGRLLPSSGWRFPLEV